MVCNTKSVPMLRLIERRALAQLNSTRTFVALGFFPALLAREVARRRYLRLWWAVRDGNVPNARKYALIGRGPGVDPSTQERTYFDCLAAVDTFRENDDLEGDFEESAMPTQADNVLDWRRRPSYSLDFYRDECDASDEAAWAAMKHAHNMWADDAFSQLCRLGQVARVEERRCWVTLPLYHGTARLEWARLWMRDSGWLKLELGIRDLGANEDGDFATDTDPAQPVVEWEGGIAAKQRRHTPLPSVDLDFAEVEIKLHQWDTAVEYIDQQVAAGIDVYVEPVQARYEDLVLYTGAVVEGHTAALNVGEPIA